MSPYAGARYAHSEDRARNLPCPAQKLITTRHLLHLGGTKQLADILNDGDTRLDLFLAEQIQNLEKRKQGKLLSVS